MPISAINMKIARLNLSLTSRGKNIEDIEWVELINIVASIYEWDNQIRCRQKLT